MPIYAVCFLIVMLVVDRAARAQRLRRRVPDPARRASTVAGARRRRRERRRARRRLHAVDVPARDVRRGRPTEKNGDARRHDARASSWCSRPLIALIFVMGVYPKPFLDMMRASVAHDPGAHRAAATVGANGSARRSSARPRAARPCRRATGRRRPRAAQAAAHASLTRQRGALTSAGHADDVHGACCPFLRPCSPAAAWAMLVLVVEMFSSQPPLHRRRLAVASSASAASSALALQPRRTPASTGGALAIDGYTVFFTVLTCVVSDRPRCLLSIDYLPTAGVIRGEYYPLLLFAVLGVIVSWPPRPTSS